MDRHRNQHTLFCRFLADRRLLRKWDLTDVVPAPVRQPVLRLCQHRAGSLVLPQQRVQVHCYPKLYHPDSRRCRSNNCRALRSRFICADHQSILSSILIFVISYQRYPQRLRFTLGLKVLRKIFSYSAYQFLFNVINYFSRNLDKLLIGKYMSLSALGYYEKSYRLMMLPLQNITQVITPVMHPIFSDFQNDKEKLATSYERIVRFLSFIGLPLSVLLFFTAEEVTLLFLVINGCLRFLYSGYCHFRSVFRSYSPLQALFFRQQVIQGAFLSADSFRPYLM